MPDTDPNLPEGDGAPAGTTRFYTQEQLDAERERVRQEERDKLYPTISKTDERAKALDAEVRELRAFQKKQEKAEADRQAAIEAERQKAAEAELSAKELVERRNAEFQAKLAQMQAEQDQKIALMAKEVEFSRLQAYTQRRISEESDNIAPELLKYVTGNTPEEVEASIEQARETTASIVANMQQAGIRQRAAMPGVAPSAGTNGVGPMDQQGSRELSAEDIQGMGMQEFAALRQRLGMGGANNQGLFRA